MRMDITREQFDAQRRPRFGTANPERMRCAFWEWMIRADDPAPESDDETGPLGQVGMVMSGGVLKSMYGPYRARDRFQIPFDPNAGPIWTFDRFGRTQTELPDGRVVCVGGEHEDYYDPDFHIYNDVIVFGPDDRIEIYGYPKEAFPPTDFHTASLYGNRIIIVGRLGYQPDRRPGHTPVFALDLSDFSISELPTTGTAPGWLFEHEAETTAEGVLTVRGGELIAERDGARYTRVNVEDFALDLRTGEWRQLTSRNWAQFRVHRADRKSFPFEYPLPLEALYPQNVEHTVVPCDEWNQIRFVVGGAPVTVTVESSAIRVLVAGAVPEQLAHHIAEGVRANAAAASQQPCVLRID
jgi:hypothetical protein